MFPVRHSAVRTSRMLDFPTLSTRQNSDLMSDSNMLTQSGLTHKTEEMSDVMSVKPENGCGLNFSWANFRTQNSF